MIALRTADDTRFFALFECVRFEYLSVTSIQSFISLYTETFELFTFSVWQSVCRRLTASPPIHQTPLSPEFSAVLFRDRAAEWHYFVSYVEIRWKHHGSIRDAE
jgi:hypothetical protein